MEDILLACITLADLRTAVGVVIIAALMLLSTLEGR
jgi:hypothetical protein